MKANVKNASTMSFLETLEKHMNTTQRSSGGRVFDNNTRGGTKEITGGEAYLAFGKVVDRNYLNDGKDHGFVALVSMCIDNLEDKILSGSDSNEMWNTKVTVQNKYYAGFIKMREQLIQTRNETSKAQVKYFYPWKDLPDFAFQLRVRSFEQEAEKYDLDKINENNDIADPANWI